MRTAKTGAAFGLAALTLASSLSLGTAAQAAPAEAPDTSTESKQPRDGDTYPAPYGLSAQTDASGTTKFFVYGVKDAYMVIYGAEDSGWPRGGVCSNAGNNGDQGVGKYCSVDLWKTYRPGSTVRFYAQQGYFNDFSPKSGYISVQIPYGPVGASLVELDKALGTAEISGHARPGASVIIDGYDKDIVAEADGTWTATVPGMKIGANEITFEEWLDGAKQSDGSLAVQFDIHVLEAAGAFEADIDEKATIFGTAEPGAVVHVADGAQHEETVDANGDGGWTLGIAAPGAGAQTFTVTQQVYGQTSLPQEVTLDYGSAVTITSPADGDEVEGDFTLRGKTTKGNRLSVYEGKVFKGEIPDDQILANGTWSYAIEAVDGRQHSYTVKQLSKGNLTTTQSITVNPSDQGSADVVVTNPADPAKGYAPGTAFTFTGTGEPRKTITVQNKFGTVLGTDVVQADGTWKWTRTNMGTSIWQLEFVQDKGTADEKKATVYDFKPNAAPAPVVTVTNPVNPADGYPAQTSFTFTGTATAGKTITVQNVFGT
ncbi:hypothetical protein ES689_15440, partial [Frigoribacterium sp. ACAM 257]|uniref:hypothetical protein n=1 Tax=Frigoribacterium sp. ACAM 257 TaxID=2508998 RepID=UPI0011B9DFFA